MVTPCWRCKGTEWSFKENSRAHLKGRYLATCKHCGVVEGLFEVCKPGEKPTQDQLEAAYKAFLDTFG